jgi:hypothetical protein
LQAVIDEVMVSGDPEDIDELIMRRNQRINKVKALEEFLKESIQSHIKAVGGDASFPVNGHCISCKSHVEEIFIIPAIAQFLGLRPGEILCEGCLNQKMFNREGRPNVGPNAATHL